MNSYFNENEVASLELPDNTSTSNDVLTSKIGSYKIKLSEIYNGTFTIKQIPDITKNKWKYLGTVEYICSFDKSGNVYIDGVTEPYATYTLDGNVLTASFGITLEWDGEKFTTTLNNGEGGVITINLTEIVPKTFTFTIDGTEYTAEENMTWGDWCNSEYNKNHTFTCDPEFGIWRSGEIQPKRYVNPIEPLDPVHGNFDEVLIDKNVEYICQPDDYGNDIG